MLDEDKYAELFPTSRRLLDQRTPTFGEYAQLWLDSLEVTPGTRKSYLRELNNRWMPLWATKKIDAIRPVDVRTALGNLNWPSAHAKNKGLTIIKQVFNAAIRDEVVVATPFRVIEQVDAPPREIDPFSTEERDQIITWLYTTYTGDRAIYAAFFEFAFFTGMRITELLALRWGDIDFNQRTATVRAILAEKEIHSRTKTKKPRTVRLLTRAMHALSVAKPLTFMRSEFIFAPPVSRQHLALNGDHFSNTEQTRYIFKRALKKLGIRERRQRDTRHTFACLALMAGAKPAFIAQQLGHSLRTLLKHYAKWINTVDDWAEVQKLENSYFGTNSVQLESNPQKKPANSDT